MARPTVPYGHWPSTILPADVAAGSRRFGIVQGDGAWIYWTEGRPAEKGRQTLMRAQPGSAAQPQELLPFIAPSVAKPNPAQWSARSRVHEYGGGEFLAIGGIVCFVNDADQDVYELTPGETPRRITNEPSLRFADLTLDRARRRLVCVAERHVQGQHNPDNLLVAIELDGAARGKVTELVTGRDFYACPRLSPDGSTLAFIAWDLPGMPWDEAELCVAPLDAAGIVGSHNCIAGGNGVAASHPAWGPDGTLVFISDETGFGALSTWRDGVVRQLPCSPCEFGRPMWTFGSSPFVITPDNRILASTVAGRRADGVHADFIEFDLASGSSTSTPRPQLDTLTELVGAIAGIVSTSDAAPHIVTLSRPDAAAIVVRSGSDVQIPDGQLSRPSEISFSREGGETVHALYYPPRNDAVDAPAGTLPPALVLAHGGPTSSANRALSPRIQFYTSRGFAVLDADYAGSTGYGRKYRERLDGQWGFADVADCAAAARFLAAAGYADPARIAIAGGSAGGYTVLMALATTKEFAAGSSHYGISDLSLLMEHTHKFEAGYLHRLLGTTPDDWKDECRKRSPITLVDGITAPLILFQGLEDKVVPPEQSRLIAETLKAKGQTVELHEFPGEGHGFRRAETVVAVLEAELAFLLRAMPASAHAS